MNLLPDAGERRSLLLQGVTALLFGLVSAYVWTFHLCPWIVKQKDAAAERKAKRDAKNNTDGKTAGDKPADKPREEKADAPKADERKAQR